MLLNFWTTRSPRQRSMLLAAAALLLMLANLALHYPGTMNHDSHMQYAEAMSGRYTDWHPPIMAMVWTWLDPLVRGPAAMLVLHLGMHWLGFGLLADGLARSGRHRTALCVLLAGVFPVLVFYNGGIWKDVGMASALIAGVGMGAWFRLQQRSLPVWVAALMAVPLAYGTLVRTNAIFALGPLLLFLYFDQPSRKLYFTVACSVVISVVALVVSGTINQRVIGAQSSGAVNSLQIFDLAGIARQSGDVSVLPPAAQLTIEDVQRCYTPYFWDTFSPWGYCKIVSERLGPANSAPRQELGKQWLHAIVTHPVAYLDHRLRVFNSEMFFLVPARHCRLAPGCGVDNPWVYPGSSASTAEMNKEIRLDYLKKNFLGWPVFWLAMGAAIMLLVREWRASTAGRAGVALLLSGELYLLPYIVVGVASDVRYAYWAIMAILLAGLLLVPFMRAQLMRRGAPLVCAVLLVSLVLVAGFAARLADFRGLL